MNVFDCAIRMEEEAKIYYEELAAATELPEMKNLFSILAAAENEHYNTLVGMKADADPQKARFKSLQEAQCAFRPLLTRKELLSELKDDPDAYKHAVTKEEEDVRFYEELASKADDEDIRRLLLKIADEERKHLSIVENIYSFMKNPQTYLAWGEFSNLAEY